MLAVTYSYLQRDIPNETYLGGVLCVVMHTVVSGTSLYQLLTTRIFFRSSVLFMKGTELLPSVQKCKEIIPNS